MSDADNFDIDKIEEIAEMLSELNIEAQKNLLYFVNGLEIKEAINISCNSKKN